MHRTYPAQPSSARQPKRGKGRGKVKGARKVKTWCIYGLFVIARNVVTKQSLDDGSKQRDCRATLAMTNCSGFDVDLKIPFRLAEKRRMSWGFGVCLFERSEFTPRQLIRASQGTRRASMRVLLLFFWCVSLSKQRQSNSSMKDETISQAPAQ